MALTPQQQQRVGAIILTEANRQADLGNTAYLVVWGALSAAERRAATIALVQAQRTSQQGAKTNSSTAFDIEIATLQAIEGGI